MKKLIDAIKVTFSPKVWFPIHPYNKRWDHILNRLLDEEELVIVDEYTATLGGTKVWIANHAYGSFLIYTGQKGDLIIKQRPSRATLLKAGKLLKKAIEKSAQKSIDEFFSK